MSYVNVIISDGNRFVNCDYEADTTIGHIIQQLKFKPIEGTVRVDLNGCIDPSRVRLMDCPQEISPDGKQMRVRVMMDPVPNKKKLIPVAENQDLEMEVEADVH